MDILAAIASSLRPDSPSPAQLAAQQNGAASSSPKPQFAAPAPTLRAAIAAPAPLAPVYVAAWPSRPPEHQPTPCAWLDVADPLRVPSPPFASTSSGNNLFELPSLSLLSEDHLSINQAYYGSYPASMNAFPAAPPVKPFTTACRPVTHFHLQCRDAAGRRGGAKTVSLVFEAASSADAEAGRAQPNFATIHLSLRYYGYKSLMNPNAHYHRGRYGCVMLSRSLGFHVTACSSPHDLVLLSKQGWYLNTSAAASHPPIALAVDTCYQITFLSDDHTVTVRCVGEAQHDDLRLEWNHAASLPSAASVTSTPVSAAAASSWSPSFSTSARLSPSSSARAATVQTSCHNCRIAKAKCEEQRPCTRCVRTHRSATCADVVRKTVTLESDSDIDMSA